MSASPFKIAIVGAGPGGCMLGRLLYLSGISFTLFEGEVSRHARSQGGTLDLRPEKGLAALHAAKLYDEFLKFARWEGEAMKVTDRRLRPYVLLPGSKKRTSAATAERQGVRPEIDRLELRDMLLDSLPDGAIQWGKRVKNIDKNRKIYFTDGTAEGGWDLIVGADGTWSKVRGLLTERGPDYSGLCGTEMYIQDPKMTYPELYKLVNNGSVYTIGEAACGTGHGISLQQIGDGSIRVAEWGDRPAQWAIEHDAKNGCAALKKLLLSEYASWDPLLLKAIEVSPEDSIVTRSMWMMPKDFTWESKSGITIIGDAAHVMVPFAGEGANLAMADSMLLAELIKASKTQEELDNRLRAFETEMRGRVIESWEWSYGNMTNLYFTKGAPGSTAHKYVREGIKNLQGPILAWLLAWPLYIFYWCLRRYYGEL